MADQKDPQAKKPAQPSSSVDTGGERAAGVRAGNERTERASAMGASDEKPPASVVRRKHRYMIGSRNAPLISSGQSAAFLARLELMDGVQTLRKLRPRAAAAYPAAAFAPTLDIVVVEMDEHLGEALRQHAPPQVIVEVDAPVSNPDLAALEPFGWQLRGRVMPFPRAPRALRFMVTGAGDRPLANTAINLFGPGFPTQASTDEAGLATLPTFATDATAIQALYLRPAADHWEHYVRNPSVDFDRVNVVRLRQLSSKPANSSAKRPHGWGQRIMQFDRSSAEWSGVGIKIGVIDSGCDTSHPSLRHVVHGTDLTRDRNAESWRSDELGQGTHCSGIIAGAVVPGSDLVGCAPGAELHVFKVVPGGHCSDLIEALDACIDQRLDIVQIGVHTECFSELLAQKIGAAQRQGIICVMGAGNSGGPVQFPAGIPGVLTVGAVGKLGEYPADTRHAQRALPQIVPDHGLFSTYFSCWGPQVAVCAPGVAIVSSVPGGGYAAWDGSSMAASHVTGLAALLLSRHPALQISNFAGQLEQRANMLIELIRSASTPLVHADPNRVGAGLPDLARVPAITQLRMGYGLGTGAAEWMPGPVPPYFSDPAAAIRQMQAAGIWA
jgi:subtilisin family serine protease